MNARTRTRVVIGLVYYAMTLPGCDDDDAECVEARVSVGGRGACPPGGATCVGYPARSTPLSLPSGSFQVPDGTPPTPRNCWNYYFIPANRARESPVSITSFDSLDTSIIGDSQRELSSLFPITRTLCTHD